MEHTNRILNLFLEGISPPKIAETCDCSIGLVTQHLSKAIEECGLLRSRVLAMLDKNLQDQIAMFFAAWSRETNRVSAEYIHKTLREFNGDDFDLDVEEVKLYLFCLEKPFKDGDMYEALCEIERTLHTKIRTVLTAEFGKLEIGWWRKGVPEKVRLDCVCNGEKETEPERFGESPYNYTTLINLKEIIEYKSNRDLFRKRLPLNAIAKSSDNWPVSKDLARLNKIRNRVMHPIGAVPPTEEQFFFVKEMQAKYDVSKWR